MEYLPVALKLTDAPVLLVGGGTVATRKARLLLKSGAQLTVVAPAIEPDLQALLQEHAGTYLQKPFAAGDLDDQQLVVAATADTTVNQQVSVLARTRSLPVNVVDAPDLCTFIFPAIIDRNPVLVSVTSSGRSPVLARLLRRRIESLVPAAFGRLAEFAGRLREPVMQGIPDDRQRRGFWERLLEGPVAEKVLAGREAEAEDDALRQLETVGEQSSGEVFLIGAGPGDPDLLTFKAARLLQKADVVLYDALVSEPILEMSRRDAQRIYVGKRRAKQTLPQTEINQLLLQLAQEGKCVARLKGGDPFIFGRGGEEIELLAQNGIAFQVVPGVTAASGAACYAGIPLTHRDHAQSVRFVAGYLKGDKVDHDWSQLQSETETLVFYMGLAGLPTICSKLQEHGRASDTPVALIEHGTVADQRVLIGTLGTMEDIVRREKPSAPTLIIVGDVVTLHEGLAWFGRQE